MLLLCLPNPAPKSSNESSNEPPNPGVLDAEVRGVDRRGREGWRAGTLPGSIENARIWGQAPEWNE